MENEDDMELIVNEFHSSKDSAIKKLFNILYDPLLYFATQFVGNREIAEEIVADSFMKLWQKRADFNNYNQIKSFLYVCTKNACLNTLRDTGRKPVLENVETIEDAVHHDVDLLDRMIRAELVELLYTKIEALPEQQRNVIRLTIDEELTVEEISERLGISVNAVYANRSRAISLLKNQLRANYWILFVLMGRLIIH